MGTSSKNPKTTLETELPFPMTVQRKTERFPFPAMALPR